MSVPVTKPISLSPDQVKAVFDLVLRGQLQTVCAIVPPNQIAEVLMDRAANVLASIQNEKARQVLGAQIARQFTLSIETHAIAMRTSPGGIINPNGVGSTKQ